MSEYKTRWKRISLAALAGGLLGLVACDRQDERVGNFEDIIGAAVEQVAGGGADGDDGTSMADVPVDARAFAAPARTQDPQMASQRPRFAIGSIIAKPRDVPPPPSPQEALMMQAPDLALEMQAEPILKAPADTDEPSGVETAPEGGDTAERGVARAPVLNQRPRQVEEGIIDLEPPADAPEVRMPRALPRSQMKLARRELATPQTIEVQSNARSLMLDTMSELGVSGQVELTRTGQMVIQIGADGADPTQLDTPGRQELFTAQGAVRPDLPQLAVTSDIQCPERVEPAALRASPVLATECLVSRLKASGQFEYVEKDFIFEHQFVRRPSEPPVRMPVKPNDALWSLQWHFFNNGTGEGESPGGAGFVDFWTDNDTTGSRDVVVAVVDTGLDMDHPDIRNSLNVAPGWDMVSDPRMGNDGDGRDPDANDPGDLCDPSVPFSEDSFHGTHVAGTIGAAVSNNATGVAAGAWNVTVVPVRALGKCGGRLTDINDAIRWAGGLVPAIDEEGNEVWNENPADIINLSIGLFEFCPASLQDAINAVTERGVVVVSAAGNARVPTRFYSPGGCENVVSVAAGDARGAMAPYSNFGDEVDVLAPGGDLARDDNGDGRPDGILSTRLASNCFDPVSGNPVETCYYAFEQGTSMAAPHVAAALALIKSREPALVGSALVNRMTAALSPRTGDQCTGPCNQYPGAEPSPDNPEICLRPCGGGLLNLSDVEIDGGTP